MIREFVSFGDAASMLQSDADGLQQALELGLGMELPAYVYAGVPPFLAYPFGTGVEAEATDIHDAVSAVATIPGFGVLAYFDLWGNTLGDGIGEVGTCDDPQSQTGRPFSVTLSGYFRVLPYELRGCAKEGHVGMVAVAPESWWQSDCKVPKGRNGEPLIAFRLAASREIYYAEMPALEDLRFRIADIEALKAKRLAAVRNDTGDAEKPLAPRTRNNLLRVIAALCKEAKIELGSGKETTQLRVVLDAAGFRSPDDKTLREFLRAAADQLPDA